MRRMRDRLIRMVMARVRESSRRSRSFPYSEYIAADEAAIRSGAGRNFYATGKLQAGETVEVYQHDG